MVQETHYGLLQHANSLLSTLWKHEYNHNPLSLAGSDLGFSFLSSFFFSFIFLFLFCPIFSFLSSISSYIIPWHGEIKAAFLKHKGDSFLSFLKNLFP